MTNKPTTEEIENQIQSLLNEPFLLSIRADLNKSGTEWNNDWIELLRKFFENRGQIEATFDIKDTFIEIIHDFTHWSERSLAAQVFDLMSTLILFQKSGRVTPESEEFDACYEQICSRANEMYPNWEETHEIFDNYAPRTIQEMFTLVFILLINPTHEHLFPDMTYSRKDEELGYLYSIGLYITYQSFNNH